jgi:acetylornithine deacetylase/succinyl-diaminopimelate desuccinylase family protein
MMERLPTTTRRWHAGLLDQVASCRDEMASLAEDLIRVPTENPPGHAYEECVRVLERALASLGLGSELLDVPGAPGAAPRFVLRSFLGQGTPTLYFHGHYDVVPADRPDQFRPRRERGSLFGRGSADMKGGLVAMIFAVKALARCEVPLQGRVGLVFVPDEETGGRWGSRHLAEAGLLGENGVGMLTAEPTGGIIWNANRGALSLRVEVKGRPAHVGLHYRGVNAFEGMLEVARALLDLRSEVEMRKTRYAIRPEAARSSVLLLGGQCASGENFNVVPGRCGFTVDRRFNPEEDLETEKGRLFACIDRLRARGLDLEVEILQEGSAAGVPEEAPLARSLAESVREVTGRPSRFEMCPGLLEIRFYIERGVPALAYGPGSLRVSHGPLEYVKVERLEACAAVYALTAARMLAPGADGAVRGELQ